MARDGTCGMAENSTYEDINPMQGVTLALIAAPGIIANTFAVIVTARMLRNQKVVPNVFVLALACCDLFGIFMICWPTWLCYAYKTWTGGDVLCNFQGFMTLFTSFGSGLLATFLALDRYLSIKAPFFHRENISYRSAKKAVVAILIFSAVISIMPVFGFGSYVLNLTGTYCTINWFAEELKDKLYSYFFAGMGFLMISVVLFCNIHVVIILIKRRNSSKKLQGMKSKFKHVSKPKKTASERLQRQYERMMIVISLLFLICWTPFMIRIIGNISGMWCSWSADLQASRLLLLNLVLDPFVYVLARKQYREAFYKHCCCCLPCLQKNRKESVKIKFAYSASLSNQSDRNRSQTIITQIGDTGAPQPFRARDELSASKGGVGSDWRNVTTSSQSTEVLVHTKPADETKEKQQRKSNGACQENGASSSDHRLSTCNSKGDRKSALSILKDKRGILPTITKDEVKEALQHLSKDSGMDNEGMEREDGGSSLLDDVMSALKVCFASDSPAQVGKVYDHEQRYSRLEKEKQERKKRKSTRQSNPDIYNKALQVMEYILTQRQIKIKIED